MGTVPEKQSMNYFGPLNESESLCLLGWGNEEGGGWRSEQGLGAWVRYDGAGSSSGGGGSPSVLPLLPLFAVRGRSAGQNEHISSLKTTGWES